MHAALSGSRPPAVHSNIFKNCWRLRPRRWTIHDACKCNSERLVFLFSSVAVCVRKIAECDTQHQYTDDPNTNTYARMIPTLALFHERIWSAWWPDPGGLTRYTGPLWCIVNDTRYPGYLPGHDAVRNPQPKTTNSLKAWHVQCIRKSLAVGSEHKLLEMGERRHPSKRYQHFACKLALEYDSDNGFDFWRDCQSNDVRNARSLNVSYCTLANSIIFAQMVILREMI